MNPRFEGGIPDFMGGIPNFMNNFLPGRYFNVVHRKVHWPKPNFKS